MDDTTEIRITLRLPAELRDKLTASASSNARSMNGEILARLRASFLNEMFIMMSRAERDHLEERLESLQKAPRAEDRTIYVALDADGLPISWPEIMAHLGEIGRAGNFDIQKIEARVFDPKLVAGDKREEQWWNLIQKYRKLRAARAIRQG